MILALIPFLVLLLGAGLIPLVAHRWPRFVSQTAVSVSGVVLLIWLIARTQLPISANFGNWAASGVLPTVGWQIDLLSWQLSVTLFLLLFAVSLSKLYAPSDELRPFTYIFLLTAVSLIAIWSANITTAMIGLTLLILPWLLAIWRQMSADYGRLLRYLLMVVVAIGLLWFGVAQIPMQDVWASAVLPQSAATAIALAGVILAGIWPFSGWRLRIQDVPATVTVFVFIMPTAIGGMILARLVDLVQLSLNLQLLLSLMALFGLLRGIRLAWVHLDSARTLALGILFAQAQLMILSAVWVNGVATIAELRVLILAGGILFLAPAIAARRGAATQRLTTPEGRGPALNTENEKRQAHHYPWQMVAPIFALASLAAIPLTTGFVGRAALYTAWIENGRFLFVLVLALLTIPLVTAVYLRFWPKTAESETDEDESVPSELTVTEIGRDVGLIFLSLGLITILGVGWGEMHPIAFVMILLATVIGLVLPRFLGELQPLQEVVQQAFSFGSALQSERLKTIGQDLGTAVRDAAKILEGEGGLVWLFILAVLFFLLS